MIVKKIKYTNFDKTKAQRIGNLVDYIRNPQATNAQEKVAHSGGRNFLTDTHHGQRAEMIALSQETVHSKMPVNHWILSWREGEQPTREQVEEAVDMFLEGMEYKDHQTIYALHQNTDNFHLHIAVNRMNEITGKVARPHNGFDIKAAHRVIAKIENKQGWQSEKNSLYSVLENGEIATRKESEKTIKPRPKAIDFENATGEKSAQRIAQEKGHEIISKAKTWEELHGNLKKVGMRFEKKGSGAIVFVGDIAIKASSIDRNFSMGKLCKKLGKFVTGDYPEDVEKLPTEPVSTVNIDEWQKYQATCLNIENNNINEKAWYKQEITKLKESHRKHRESVVENLKSHGISILNIARYFLAIQQKEELKKLRGESKPHIKKRPRFAAWLQKQGLDKKAELWRYRNAFEKKSKTLEQIIGGMLHQNKPETKAFEDYAIAVNADRYRVTCIKIEKSGDKKTFILDKQNGVTKGFTGDGLWERIPEMLRLQERGENIYYTPLSENKHHILIDDMTEESLTLFKEKGYAPAVILESSPNNYQCILTIPKLGSVFDRDIGNRLTERLNKIYGDKKLSGCIHPHRAPEFENRKEKNQKTDGTFPKVKLLEAKKQECRKAYNLSRLILKEYEEATKEKREQERKNSKIPQPLPIGNPTSAYYLHYENIKKHLVIEDFSRMDAMIALRMRATGHSPQAVFEAVRECAKNIRAKEGRNWEKYAERTANYAFGIAGDIALRDYGKYREHWNRIEHGQSLQEKHANRDDNQVSSPRMRM